MTSTSPGTARRLLAAIAVTLLVVAAMVFVHESAHYVAARTVGIPAADVHYSWCPRGPCVVMTPDELPARISIVHYAGGLTAGALLVLCYFAALAVLRRRPTPFAWMLGSAFATLACYQLANGVVEGALHDAYIRGAAFTSVAIVGSAWLGAVAHLLVVAPLRKYARRAI